MPVPLSLKILLVVPILACAAISLSLAGLVLIRNRPVVLNNRLLAAIILLVLAPALLGAVRYVSSGAGPGINFQAVVLAGLFLLLMAVIWRAMSGYAVIGVNESSLRACLLAALSGLSLPFEETIGGFRLPSMGDTLQVRYQPRLDTASLRLESPRDKATMSRIAVAARAQFQSSRGSGSLNAVVFYGGSGLIFLILALYQWNRFN